MHGTDGQLVALNYAAMTQHGVILLLVATIVPNIMATYGIGESATGLLLGLGSVGFMVGPLLAGTLIDKINVRFALAIGIVIELVTLVMFGMAGVFFAAALANLLLHLGSSFVETGANVMPTLTKSKNSAHSNMNMVHMFFSAGAFVGPFLIGLYVGATGEWRPTMYFAMIPTGLLLIWTLLVRFPNRGAAGIAQAHSTAKPRPPGQFGSVVRRRYVILGAFALFFYVGAEVGVSSWVVYYLQQKLHLPAVSSAAGLSVVWLFMMIGRYLNSVLGKRFSSRALVTVSGIGGAAGVLLFLLASSIGTAYAILAWVGLCLSGVFPNIMAELNHRDPRTTGTVTAVMATGAAAGAALFQWIVGFLAETVSLTVAFVVPAVAQLAVVFLFAGAVAAANRSAGLESPASQRLHRP